MKYSDNVYIKGLETLAELRENLTESEQHTLDFIAEAIAEKGDRDKMRCEDCAGFQIDQRCAEGTMYCTKNGYYRTGYDGFCSDFEMMEGGGERG